MTLIVVLWTVAALTVLVTGLVRAQRSELRLAGVAKAGVLAQAQGQAAIAQVAQRLLTRDQGEARLQRWREVVDGVEVDVEAAPLGGLVDLNKAPEPLLGALFAGPGRLDAGAAQALAREVLAWRQSADGRGGQRRFDLVDELLAVPGADPDLFARIAPFVTTDSAGSGRVNPLAAPLPILVVLAHGDADTARRIAADRDAGAPAIDTSRLDAALLDATASNRYRFTARVPGPGGQRGFDVVRDLDLRARRPGGPPWQTLRAVVQRVPELTGP
jgi:general secretion pathway protein K